MESSLLTSPMPVMPDTTSPSSSAAQATAPRSDRVVSKIPDNNRGKSFAETLEANDTPATPVSLSSLKAGGQRLTKESPVLSLVTGQLENINPQDIPTLVAKNAFLNSALTADDLNAFMQTPMPLGDILKSLGIGSDLANKIRSAGMDLKELISLKDVLKGLGIDPSRVVAEISLLKQNLPFEGVAPYMKRAAVLRGQAKVDPGMGREELLGERLNPLDLEERQDSSKKNSGQADLAGSAVAFTPPTVQPINLTKANGVQTPQQPSIKTNKTGTSSAVDPTALLNDIFGGVSTLGASVKSALSSSDLPQNPIEGVAKAAEPVTEFGKTDKPSLKADLVNKDPFALLGEQMLNRSVDVAPLASAKAMSQSDMLDALMAKQFVADNGIKPSINTAVPMSTVKTATPELSLFQENKNMPALDMSDWLNQTTPNFTAKADILSGKNAVAPLPVSAFAVTSLADTPSLKDQGLGSGTSRNSEEEETENIKAPHLHQSGTEKLFDLDGKVAVAPKIENTAAARADVVQKLLDGAHVAMKQGNSSIRVNLGSSEHGPLDVALKVNNGVVDMRVVTDSQDMRNILGQDLPKLREALSQQNLTLGRVEVGVDSGWAQSFAGQSNQRWNNHATRQWEEMIDQPKSASILPSRDTFGDFGIRSISSRGYGIPSFATRDAGHIQVAI